MGFFGRLGSAFGVTAPDVAKAKVDTSGLEQQRQQDNAAYQQWLAQSNGTQYNAPQFDAAQTQLAGTVTERDPGAAERYQASLVNAPVPVQLSLRQQSNGVTAQNAATPVAGAAQAQDTGIDQAQSNQVRTEQMGNIGALENAAAGNGPSGASSLFSNAMGDVTQTQLGTIGQARGTDRAAQRREAIGEMGRQGLQAANQAAMLKAQEQNAARGQLTGALSDTRGTDASLASQNAGLLQNNRQFNAGAQTDVSKYQAGIASTMNTNNADRNLAAQEFTAGQQNQRDLTGAQLGLTAQQTNAANQLAAGTTNAGLQTGAAATNAAAGNQREEYRSNLANTVDTGNVTRAQGVNDTNAGLKQQANISNQGAAIHGEQVNQGAKQNLRSDALTASGQAINAESNAVNANANLAQTNANNQNDANKASADRLNKTVTGLIGGIAQGGAQKMASSAGGGGGSSDAGDYQSSGGGTINEGFVNQVGEVGLAQTLAPSAPAAPPAPGIPTNGAAGYNAMMAQYGPPPPTTDYEKYQQSLMPLQRQAVY